MKRDPYRLSPFAMHLQPDERPRAFLPIRDGTLLVTDQRILAFRPHAEADDPDNRGSAGYEVAESIPVDDVRGIERRIAYPIGGPPIERDLEERLILVTTKGPRVIVVARGPRPDLTEEDLTDLEQVVIEPHAK